jgi:polar amino acid transport system ATP-binding protein
MTATTTVPMVEARGVHKYYGSNLVVKGIDLTVAQGEVMCLLGPSGSGKSTFLRCINHLEKINAGTISVAGELVGYREQNGRLYELRDAEIATRRSDIGMVFQQFNLFPHLTVLENLTEAPVQVRREKVSVASERARELLDRVGLADKADAYPRSLSASRSPALSTCARNSCCSTSRRRRSTPNSSARSST